MLIVVRGRRRTPFYIHTTDRCNVLDDKHCFSSNGVTRLASLAAAAAMTNNDDDVDVNEKRSNVVSVCFSIETHASDEKRKTEK